MFDRDRIHRMRKDDARLLQQARLAIEEWRELLAWSKTVVSVPATSVEGLILGLEVLGTKDIRD